MLGTDDEQHYWDCHDAAAEIERLRGELARTARERDSLRAALKNLADCVAEISFTDEEREAIAYYIGTGGPDTVDATLRGLLERLK